VKDLTSAGIHRILKCSLQGSESREKLIEKLGLDKYMDNDAEEDEERIVEVILSFFLFYSPLTDYFSYRYLHVLLCLDPVMARASNGFQSTCSVSWPSLPFLLQRGGCGSFWLGDKTYQSKWLDPASVVLFARQLPLSNVPSYMPLADCKQTFPP
jgi:hypothetical protein